MREFCDARMLSKMPSISDLSSLSIQTKIPKKHLELVAEILEHKSTSKEYRLRVKKRLFRDNLEVILCCS